MTKPKLPEKINLEAIDCNWLATGDSVAGTRSTTAELKEQANKINAIITYLEQRDK